MAYDFYFNPSNQGYEEEFDINDPLMEDDATDEDETDEEEDEDDDWDIEKDE